MTHLIPTCLKILLLLLFSFAACADQLELNLVSQNLNRFFDDRDDGNKEPVFTHRLYRKRLNQLIEKISDTFQFADVLAFQEVENIDILLDISRLLEKKHSKKYQAVLIEGNDGSGIDSGFLVKKPYRIKSSQALFKNRSYNSKGEKLYSRPPLLIEICHDKPGCFSIVNLHLRSMRGLRSYKKGRRVALKRLSQAETLATWINSFQQQHTDKHLIIVGDFNALTPADAYVDSIGIILGNPDQSRPNWKSTDRIKRDLIDVSKRLPPQNRTSYIYKRKKQQLDYILVSSNLNRHVKSIHFTDIDYSFSDHAAVIVRFALGQM